MMNKIMKRGLWFVVALLLSGIAQQTGAQTGGEYHLYQSTFETGGGTSSDNNNVFTLRGALDQTNPFVARGGGYTLVGRFWGQYIIPESLPKAAPAPNYFITQDVTFTWNRITDAAVYQVQVSRNSTFTDIVYTSPEIDGNTLFQTNSSWPNNGTYYWHVRAKNSVGKWSAWSKYNSFIVNAP